MTELQTVPTTSETLPTAPYIPPSMTINTPMPPQTVSITSEDYAALVAAKTNYDAFVALGYRYASDVTQALSDKDTTIKGMNDALATKNASLAQLQATVDTNKTKLVAMVQSRDSFMEIAQKVPVLTAERNQAIDDREMCLRAEDGQQKIIAELRQELNKTKVSGIWNKILFLVS